MVRRDSQIRQRLGPLVTLFKSLIHCPKDGNKDGIKNVSLGHSESQGRKCFVKRKSNGLNFPAVM